MPAFIIENIDFDFSDAEESLTQEKKDFITENAKGVWYVAVSYTHLTLPTNREV